MKDIFFKIINYGSTDYASVNLLYEEFLLKNLGVNLLIDKFVQETDKKHMAGFLGDRIVASAVLSKKGEECKIICVVVMPDFRRTYIGSRMLFFCEQYAKSSGCRVIYCNSMESVMHFFLNNCYIAHGGYFYKNNIPYVVMRKYLLFETAVNIHDVKKIFEDLINKRISRNDAENWAINLININDEGKLRYFPKNKKDIIWRALEYLSGVDAQIEKGMYIYSIDVIENEYQVKWKQALTK